jgi:spermidine synthase
MHPGVRFGLYALFTASGLCGLVYESLWSHYLRNYLGHAAHGQTVVLVIFVGGLALGAWLAGRYTDRLRDPLLAYAAVEAGIGVFAFGFHPLFVGFTEWTYDALLPAVCAQSSVCASQWIGAALLIAVPATALGATFPWMVAGVLRRFPAAPGREISVLYCVNSLGAVAGVLASSFVLIPLVGLPGTVQIAGALNIAVGIAVAGIAWRARIAAPAPAAREKAKAAPPRETVAVLLAIAALTGLASFVYEIVWLRMLSMVLGASTHAFELMLAAFILGLALGGAWIRKRIDGMADALTFLGRVQVWMAIAALATLPLYDAMFDFVSFLIRALARNDNGYALFRIASAVVALVVMLPATFLAGMTLPLITLALLASGGGERAIGRVYAANTAGAIAGVLLAVHVLIAFAGLKWALIAGAGVDMLLGLYLLWRPPHTYTWAKGAISAAALAAVAVVAAGFDVDPRRVAASVFRAGASRIANNERVLFHADGKTASVTVVEGPVHRVLLTNGKTDASVGLPDRPPSVDEPTQVLLAALAVAANPQAKRAAVIGIGSGMTSATLLAWPSIERVDTIEIEPRMAEGASLLTDRTRAVFRDPRSHLVFDDAKAWLARSGATWDVIASEPSNPWVSGVASLFTSETYARIAKHLSPQGVFVQWLQLYEIDETLLSSIFRALAAQFPHYVVYQAADRDLIVVASRVRPVVDGALLFGNAQMAGRLQASGIPGAEAVDGRWRGDDVVASALMAAFPAPANSDFAPFVDVNAERARFIRNEVRMFAAPVAAPVPLDAIGASRPRDAAGAALASALAEAIASPPEAAYALPAAYASYEGAVRASRELMRTCRPGAPLPVLLEGAIGVAMIVNDNLDKAQAAGVWKRVREGPCYAAMASELQRWVDLFAAVAARDTRAMADLGSRLVPTAPHAFARDYALAAAAVGEIAQGRGTTAAQLIDKYSAPQKPVWMLALRELAVKGTTPNGAG